MDIQTIIDGHDFIVAEGSGFRESIGQEISHQLGAGFGSIRLPDYMYRALRAHIRGHGRGGPRWLSGS